VSIDARRTSCHCLDFEDGLSTTGNVELQFCGNLSIQVCLDDFILVELALADGVVEAVW
jgi:hypothetical protein